MDDEALTKMAADELLREAKRGAVRANMMGPEGWKKCPLPKTNKTFLNNTLRNAAYTNKKFSSRTPKLNDNKSVQQTH